MKMNKHYNELKASYLFVDIAHKVAAYQEAHPEKEIIRLGIGDVTQPLAKCVVQAMRDAAAEMGTKRGNQLVVGHPRVVLPRRAAVFRQICIAEFLIQFRNGVLPLFFGAFSAVLLHISGKFFIEQTVEIYQFHFLSPPLFPVELFRDRRYALSGFLSAFFR